MAVKLKGDKEFENVLSTKDKALRINLNENIYGTFSEIGAGQEVARHFSVSYTHLTLPTSHCV